MGASFGENGLGPSMVLALRADFVRPNRLSCRFVNSLRGSIEHCPNTTKPPGEAALSGIGGGGENRTRVRKPYATRSTCLFRL